MIALFHFLQIQRRIAFHGDLDEVIDSFITDHVEFGPYFEHIASFWSRRNEDPNIFFCSFEQLKKVMFYHLLRRLQDVVLGTCRTSKILSHVWPNIWANHWLRSKCRLLRKKQTSRSSSQIWCWTSSKLMNWDSWISTNIHLSEMVSTDIAAIAMMCFQGRIPHSGKQL